MKTFAEKFIKEISVTELDLDYPFYDGLGDEEERNEVLVPNSHLSFADAPSMDIDDAITILQELKELGANRVYFASHCDHHGYYFYGTELKEI